MSGAALAQMALPGSFEVSETGAAVYTVPIAVPPGTAGLEPKLTLQYNSRSGNGLLGVGWSLGGLPAIVRCPKTMAQDGARGGVNYDANDRFCLEGERLVAISGTYGADSTEYRTEREGFSKIISYGTAGTGPAWFKVWTKAGQILEFGNTADSRIEAQGKSTARLWTVNKVSDTAGNYLTVIYAEDNTNGEYRPTRIDYTGNAAASVTSHASVRFVYETRPTNDQTPLYEAGSLIKTTQRLTKIQTYTGEGLAREYRLTYENGASTKRSQLVALMLCDGASTCLPATMLTWLDAVSLFAIVTGVSSRPPLAPIVSNSIPVSGDFNGDGRADLLFCARISGNCDYNYAPEVWLSNGDGTFAIVTGVTSRPPLAPIVSNSIPIGGDFNGDGRTDILFCAGISGACDYRYAPEVWLSNGDGTFAIVTGVSSRPPLAPIVSNSIPVSGDFNGDGRADLLFCARISGNCDYNYAPEVWLSNGDGTFAIVTGVSSRPPLAPIVSNSIPIGGDFNGDGRTDILFCAGISGACDYRYAPEVWISNGDGTFAIGTGVTSRPPLAPIVSNSIPVSGDFNGDGRADLLFCARISGAACDYNYAPEVWLSKGDGTFAIVTGVSSRPPLAPIVSNSIPIGGDFNGDGRTDFLFCAHISGHCDYNYALEMWLSNGDGTFAIATSVSSRPPLAPIVSNSIPIGGDFNGDGRTDILFCAGISGACDYRYAPEIWKSNDGQSTAVDIVGTLAAGLGTGTAITQVPLSSGGTLYAKDTGTAACAYPCVDVQGPMYVVSQVQTSNGVGGTYTSSYKYAGAKADQSGRGFLGFRQVTVKDEQTLVEQATEYLQSWPFVGLTAKRTKTRSTVELNRTENTYASDDLGSGRRFVKLTQSMESSKELTGTSLPTVTTAYQYDSYGNATQVQVSTGDGHSKTTVNTYANDIANWFLGRLTRAEVTSVAP